MTIPAIPAVDLERLKLAAAARREALKQAGEWQGSVVPHTAYQTRPLAWIVEKLGVPEPTLRWSMAPEYATHEWDGDVDPFVQACEALAAWKNVGIESATGTGKTFTAACLVFWFLACFEDALVITVAPKEDQLLKQLWKELGKLWPAFARLFPQAEMLTGLIRMKPAEAEREVWAASAFVCGVGAEEEIAGRAKGFHAEHMLIISEETQSIHAAIIAAFDHTRTADHNLHLALGNPDHQQDELHKFCERPTTVDLRISADDHPNVVTGRVIVPGAIGVERLKERKTDFAPPTSRLYLSQIRGVCPKEAEEALIRWEWCEGAAKKFDDERYRVGALALGADVADSPTGDKAAISRWQGACCTDAQDFRVKDASEVGERLFAEAMDPDHPVDPRYIGIDSVGVGASAVNTLKRLGLKVRKLGGGDRAVPGLDTDVLWSETREVEGKLKAIGPVVIEAERFADLRSQIWWRLREDLRLGRVALPNDPDLFRDLTAPTFGTPTGKIKVEEKTVLRARLGRSPNKGDAVAYGNWVRRRTPIPEARVVPGAATAPIRKNQDMGLETLLAKRAKHQQIAERQFQRALRRRGRGR